NALSSLIVPTSAVAAETAVGPVEVFVDGLKIGDAVYGGARADVCGSYPGRPGCPNVGYALNWDTSSVPVGNHTIKVVAWDSDIPRQSSSVERTVAVVRPAPVPPDVVIDGPGPDGVRVSGV